MTPALPQAPPLPSYNLKGAGVQPFSDSPSASLPTVDRGVLNVGPRAVRQGKAASDGDDHGEDDVRRDRVRGPSFVQQTRCDQWRGATGENRGTKKQRRGRADRDGCGATIAEEMPITSSVTINVALRPIRSPQCPKIAAPSGRATNPTAYVANEAIAPAYGVDAGKNKCGKPAPPRCCRGRSRTTRSWCRSSWPAPRVAPAPAAPAGSTLQAQDHYDLHCVRESSTV